MSLFAALGQGDIWALSGISFASPINDLLDKGEFTLENLLEEDELIQEVKANNERLLEFLSLETTIDNLLTFIITPASEADNLLRVYKYPYMSCEVICCEVPEILRILVENSDGRLLDKLFSFLTTESKLDYYLAGYFEKILEMLFKKMTVPMMKYFNESGPQLLSRFLDHVDNYSIMQIIQRLMLPHIPFNNVTEQEAEALAADKSLYQCNWSYSVECCQLLFDWMLSSTDGDIPLHLSDLLITVLQLSPPETLVIKFLCQSNCIDRLLTAIISEDADLKHAGDPYTSATSISLAATSVLESLNSRLFESNLPFDQSTSSVNDFSDEENCLMAKDQIESICNQMLAYIPQLYAVLRKYVESNPCEPFVNQSRALVPRLGHRGLQLVKLVESMVRLANTDTDEMLCSSGTLSACLAMFFKFENSSFLHLSVQRTVCSIFESDKNRTSTQLYLLRDCDILKLVMDSLESFLSDLQGDSDVNRIASRHSSAMGNLILMAQALSLTLDNSKLDLGEGSVSVVHDIENSVESSFENMNNDAPSFAGLEEGSIAALDDSKISKSDVLRDLMLDKERLCEWDIFVQSTLQAVLDHQLVGSYDSTPNIGISIDDSLKLGTGLELYHIDDDNIEGQRAVFDDEDDDDFMFNAPVSTPHYDFQDEEAFKANFEFMQTHEFQVSFDDDADADSFADFTSYDLQGHIADDFSREDDEICLEDFANFEGIDLDSSSSNPEPTTRTE